MNEDGNIRKGSVKWFDPKTAYGFVVDDNGGADILLHLNVLRDFGRSSVAEGASITFEVQMHARGLQVSTIHTIAPFSGIANSGGCFGSDERETSLNAAVTEFQPARVKWFNEDKGFGFANIFSAPEDIFLHAEVLRSCGIGTLQLGEAISIRVFETLRGKSAGEIRPWDHISNGN